VAPINNVKFKKLISLTLNPTQMKKILQVLIITFLVINITNAQISVTSVTNKAKVVVGKIAPMGAFIADLTYKIEGADT
jgi:hypothetical protein